MSPLLYFCVEHLFSFTEKSHFNLTFTDMENFVLFPRPDHCLNMCLPYSTNLKMLLLLFRWRCGNIYIMQILPQFSKIFPKPWIAQAFFHVWAFIFHKNMNFIFALSACIHLHWNVILIWLLQTVKTLFSFRDRIIS